MTDQINLTELRHDLSHIPIDPDGPSLVLVPRRTIDALLDAVEAAGAVWQLVSQERYDALGSALARFSFNTRNDE